MLSYLVFLPARGVALGGARPAPRAAGPGGGS